MRGVRVAFLVAAMALFVGASTSDSRLSLQCKNIARDVIINSCKGPRKKRSTEDLTKDEPASNSKDPDAVNVGGPQSSQQKQPEGIERDSMLNFKFPKLDSQGLGFGSNPFFRRLEDDYRPLLVPMPYQSMEHGMRYARSEELLGVSFSPEELEELYEKIGDRLPRNSKEGNMKIFQRVASICCANVKLCYDNPSLIPCLGY